MSHAAICAALALRDVSGGERLAAYSLASFSNREQRAWPSAALAAARAGLSHSQYLAARGSLRRRRLIGVEDAGGGRGRSPLVVLRFAKTGPWLDAEVNPRLFELTLGHSRSRGSARLLLATLAALADENAVVHGFSSAELQAAAGMADSTYRRACAGLLTTEELVLETAGGGRSNTNIWRLSEPSVINAQPRLAPRKRPARSASARPLVVSVPFPAAPAGGVAKEGAVGSPEARRPVGVGRPADPGENPAQTRMVPARKRPELTGVSAVNPGQDQRVPGANPGQDRRVLPASPPQTPPETPPHHARAGREPLNPGTSPPAPLTGGAADDRVTIIEDQLTPRGRKRQRAVPVSLATIRSEFAEPTPEDRSAWTQIASSLIEQCGETTFEIWLSPLELLGTDRAGCLLLGCPPTTRAWIAKRFAQSLQAAGVSARRSVRLADDRELQLLPVLHGTSHLAAHEPLCTESTPPRQQEAI